MQSLAVFFVACFRNRKWSTATGRVRLTFEFTTIMERVSDSAPPSPWNFSAYCPCVATMPSKPVRKSTCQNARRYSPSVIDSWPAASCIATALPIGRFSTSANCPREILFCLKSSRAFFSSAGRSRLPTWSARKGGRSSSTIPRAYSGKRPHGKLGQFPLLEGLAVFRIDRAAPFLRHRVEFRRVAGENVAAVARHDDRPDADVVELTPARRLERRTSRPLRGRHEPPHGRLAPVRVEQIHPRVLAPVLPADRDRQYAIGKAHLETLVRVDGQLHVAELAQEGKLATASGLELLERRTCITGRLLHRRVAKLARFHGCGSQPSGEHTCSSGRRSASTPRKAVTSAATHMSEPARA